VAVRGGWAVLFKGGAPLCPYSKIFKARPVHRFLVRFGRFCRADRTSQPEILHRPPPLYDFMNYSKCCVCLPSRWAAAAPRRF